MKTKATLLALVAGLAAAASLPSHAYGPMHRGFGPPWATPSATTATTAMTTPAPWGARPCLGQAPCPRMAAGGTPRGLGPRAMNGTCPWRR
jgi:hypothetical protein